MTPNKPNTYTIQAGHRAVALFVVALIALAGLVGYHLGYQDGFIRAVMILSGIRG